MTMPQRKQVVPFVRVGDRVCVARPGLRTTGVVHDDAVDVSREGTVTFSIPRGTEGEVIDMIDHGYPEFEAVIAIQFDRGGHRLHSVFYWWLNLEEMEERPFFDRIHYNS